MLSFDWETALGLWNLIYGVLTASTNKEAMEGGSVLLLSSNSSLSLRSSSSPLCFVLRLSSSSSPPSPPLVGIRFLTSSSNFSGKNAASASCSRVSVPPSAFLKENDTVSTSSRDFFPKIDKSGRFCSPRAARELALSIIYAACLEGSDPVRVFEKRVNARRELGYDFDKESLAAYNHMSFGGPPVIVETHEEADSLLLKDMKETEIESKVLAAPPKLVYSKLILRFTRKLLVAVGDRWDTHALTIDKIAPPDWKSKPAGRILEFCILHLAMAEIAVLGTRHQIVINEAVDLSKRFCDGAAPRIINGCLKTFIKDLNELDLSLGLEDKFKLVG